MARTIGRQSHVGHEAMKATAILLVGGVALAGVRPAAGGPTDRRWSPNRRLYAVRERGQQVADGNERERILVYTSAGKQMAIAHVWLVEPGGVGRVGIRGCEEFGWINNSRIFCEGTINPSTGVYLVFDARSGRELHELLGGPFTPSRDASHIASFGNVPHFSTEEEKSDSIEIDGGHVYPPDTDRERHWFRSGLAWSPDGRQVAVADHRQTDKSLWLVVASVMGGVSEYRVPWSIPAEEWPPTRDISIRWNGTRVGVGYHGRTATINVAR